MSIYDPGNYEDQPDEGTSPWVWILLGLGALIFCCVAASVAAVASLTLLGPQTEQVFDEIAGTLEAESTAVPSTIATIPPAKAIDEEPLDTGVGRVTYLENFSEADEWGTGTITAEDDESVVEAEAFVIDGALDFTVYTPEALFWSTASEDFGDGVYEITATAVDGPLDNGFGILFMFDDVREDYYVFEVSSDGFVWIGRYEQGGEVIDSFVEGGWIESGAVNQGLNVSNQLRVEVTDGDMVFYVNDQRVAEARDTTLSRGNIGVFVESFSEGGPRVRFDDFSYISR
jgi:hypothetical protein